MISILRPFVGGLLLSLFALSSANLSAQCPVKWSALSGGVDSGVNALAEMPNGDLVVAGGFITADGGVVNRIARWGAGSWSAFGAGMDGTVRALAVLQNGDLVAAGSFSTAGGVAANRIARWNGSSWLPFGTGANDTVNALAVLPNGDLVAAGNFSVIDGLPATRIARWDGTSWFTMGSGMGGLVSALTVMPNGDLVAGGYFMTAGGSPANRVARWNGALWSALGTGLNNAVLSLTSRSNGDLVVGGWFTQAGGQPAQHLARWTGVAWTSFGTGLPVGKVVDSLATLPNDDVVVGGRFNLANGGPGDHIAVCDGIVWSSWGSGANYDVRALLLMSDGNLAVGGGFSAVGAISASNVALSGECMATAMPVGPACAGKDGTLKLAALQRPVTGSSYLGECTGITTSSLALHFNLLGLTSPGALLSVMHPLGGVGCSLNASLEVALYTPPVGGVVPTSLSVPAAPYLIGVVFYNQVLQFELSGGAIAAMQGSNGIRIEIGAQ